MNSLNTPMPSERYELYFRAMEEINEFGSGQDYFHQLNQLLSSQPSLVDEYTDFMRIYVGLTLPALTISAPAKEELPTAEELMRETLELEEELEKSRLEEQTRQFMQAAERAAAKMIEQIRQEQILNQRNKQSETKPKKSGLKWSEMALVGAIAAVVALVVVNLTWHAWRHEAMPVAQVIETVDARWSGELQPPQIGEPLCPRSLDLQTGVAKVLFPGQAEVILEAPVRLDLQTYNRLFLNEGKIVTRILENGAGFTVGTEQANIIDLGTEFGIYQKPNESTDVHVFHGLVSCSPRRADSTVKTQPVVVTEGSARRVLRSGETMETIALDRNEFVQFEEFNARYQANQGSSYHRWLAYSYQIRRDPDLVVYYTFEKNALEPEMLFNYAAGTSGRMNGKLMTVENAGQPPVWTQGRWPVKSALRFDRDNGSRVVTPADADLCLQGDITIAVWLCCPEQQRGGHILSNRQEYNVNYQISVGDVQNGKYPLHFARYTSDVGSDKPKAYIQTPFEFSDGWCFLAFTYDNNVVRYYIDGVLYETVPYIFASPSPALAELVIGDTSESVPKDYSKRRFNGLMDEIAIFRRVLTPEEIQTMYNAGKPE
ncbi:MAG: FecR domain-containing protein [Sedimentisphaerales bacterium]|nr:FecR domain-containing protein [Sedimentisphaerales bacterium]